MKYKVIVSVCALFLVTAALSSLPPNGIADEQPSTIPDEALCAKMMRFGQQSYERGRYLDAKAYFRKAVQADPNSVAAWRYYDMATIFALAEKVEKNTGLIAPDVSTRGETGRAEMAQPPPQPPQPGPAKKPKFVIEQDEGC